MAYDLSINGVTYPAVEKVELTTSDGTTVVFSEGDGIDLDDGFIAQDALIAQIKTALRGKVAGGGAEPVIESLEITENGTYTAPGGVDGYSPVTVNVPTGGGGMPANLSALDCGVYNVTATSSATVNVPHKMGVQPDFCIWMITKNCESNPVAYTNITGCLLAKPALLSTTSGSIYEVFQAITGFNASRSLARTTSAVATNPMTDTHVCIVATSAYRLLAGDSYFWIAGKFDTAV